MKKRLFALLLAMMLIVAMVAGCAPAEDASTDDTSTPNADASASTEDSGDDTATEGITFPLAEPVTVSAFSIINGSTELGDTTFMKEYTEMTNVHWEIQSASSADLAEKRNLLLAANEYPDVFLRAGLANSDIGKYGSQGTFIPLQDLIADYAPTLSAMMAERPEIAQVVTSVDGNTYSMPGIIRSIPLVPMYFVNNTWLENIDMEEPKTIDELYEVLKAFKEQDANGNGDPSDEIPMSATILVKAQELLAPYYGIPIDTATKVGLIDGEYAYLPTTEEYKEILAFVTKLYSEGLMHTDSFVMEHAQQGAIGKSGDVLGTFFTNGAHLTVENENSFNYEPLTPFGENVAFANSGVVTGTVVITDVCEIPETIVAWTDYLYTEEGGMLAWMGVEDESYTVLDDGSYDWIIPEGSTITEVRQIAGFQGAAHIPGIQPDYYFNSQDELGNDNTRQREEFLAAGSAGPFVTPAYSDADSQELATLTADITAYVDQYAAQVATGALDLDESWDDYLATMEAMGAARLEEIQVNAIKAMIE